MSDNKDIAFQDAYNMKRLAGFKFKEQKREFVQSADIDENNEKAFAYVNEAFNAAKEIEMLIDYFEVALYLKLYSVIYLLKLLDYLEDPIKKDLDFERCLNL